MTKLYQSKIMTIGIILLCLLVSTRQAVVYGAIANDNDINLLQVDDKTVSTTTANNDSPHHHHIKHHISLDNSNRRLLGDGTSFPASSSTALDEHQDTLSNKPMPIKGSVSGKKHQLQSSLTSIVNTNSRILLTEDGEDSRQLLVSRGGKRLLKKKRIRAQIRNNSWGRGNNSWGNNRGRGKGRKSSKGWVGKGRKWGKSSKGAKNKRGWRNSNWYDDDDWFNEPKWNDWDKPNKWNKNDDWKNADWIEAPDWSSSSWSADWKKKEIVHVEPEHDICLQNPKDEYRTCFQRPIDPSYSDYKCQTIDRSAYNIGALLFTNSKNKALNQKEILQPYTKPYIIPNSNEELISGSITLSLLDNPMEKLDCHTSLKLEESLLTYLADNVGSKTTYFPICVSLKDTINKNSNDDIDLNKGNYKLDEVSVTMLVFDVTFVSLGESKDWSTKIGQRPQREVNWGGTSFRRDLELDDEESNTDKMGKEGEEEGRELRKETKAEIKAALKNQLNGKRKKDKLSIKDVEEEMDKVLVEERMDKILQKMNQEKQAKKKNDLIVKAGSGTNTVNKKNKDKKILKDTNRDICTAIETALCCSQRAINYQSSTKQSNQGDIDESGQYCEDLGCNWVRMCGSGRSDDQVMAWIDEDDDDGWDDDGWEISWDDDGWRRHRDRFLQDVVEPQGQDEEDESIKKSQQRILPSVGKYSYEADTTVHKYPKKDCPAYSHPNANPTWYDNYDGTDSENIRPDNTRGKNRGYAYTYTCPAYGILNDKDFNEAIRCLTPLDAHATYAQLDLYNIENAAICSINRYSLQEQKSPMITCEESDEYGCGKTDFRGDFESGKNDDLLPPVNMVQNDGEEGEFCVDLSTYTPTMFPTLSPSYYPTTHPTDPPPPTRSPLNPTQRPTNQPTRRPTDKPTLPTDTLPSASPSWSPTGVPSVQPSQGPSLASSSRPSQEPSEEPSNPPSVSKSPSNKTTPPSISIQPTLSPSATPSEPPSKTPTRSPTPAPTQCLGINSNCAPNPSLCCPQYVCTTLPGGQARECRFPTQPNSVQQDQVPGVFWQMP